MFNRISRVAFWHFLGISIFCIIMKSSDMLFGTTLITFLLKTTSGVWTLNGVGIISVSLAVWDGQFAKMVKKNHLSSGEELSNTETDLNAK